MLQKFIIQLEKVKYHLIKNGCDPLVDISLTPRTEAAMLSDANFIKYSIHSPHMRQSHIGPVPYNVKNDSTY